MVLVIHDEGVNLRWHKNLCHFIVGEVCVTCICIFTYLRNYSVRNGLNGAHAVKWSQCCHSAIGFKACDSVKWPFSAPRRRSVIKSEIPDCGVIYMHGEVYTFTEVFSVDVVQYLDISVLVWFKITLSKYRLPLFINYWGIIWQYRILSTGRVHHKKYAHDLCFVVFVLVNHL